MFMRVLVRWPPLNEAKEALKYWPVMELRWARVLYCAKELSGIALKPSIVVAVVEGQ